MAITTINSTDSGADSLTKINDNFTDLDTTKADLASPTFTGIVTTPAIKITTGASANKVLTSDADGDGTWASIPSTTGFSTTNVFNGTTVATTWTDLDLSSVIGIAQKMVLLKIYDGNSAGSSFFIRRNGDTGDYTQPAASNGVGVQGTLLANGSYAQTLLVSTDTSGVIEYYCSAAQALKIDVLAYW